MNKFAASARGDYPADIVIHNAKIANVYTSEYELADAAVYRGKIAAVGQGYTGQINYDAGGRVLIPSMIDGHIHIEDTMLTPPSFAQEAAKHGTGTVLADPHEIANALGMRGLEYMFKTSQGLPVDIFYGAPSCVPASDLESPFEELDANSIRLMCERGLVQHLGEMMNYPAVIAGDPDAWAKIHIASAHNMPLTGHAPGVSGHALNAYISSGINSDHECTDIDEAREKLSRGMYIMMREGASFKDLAKLLPLVKENPFLASRCMAVSDDITAPYLMEIGHMDAKMRIMLAAGLDEFSALRMVTLTPAQYFGLRDRGAVSPGMNADFVLLQGGKIDEDFAVSEVWKNGRLIVRDGEVYTPDDDYEQAAPVKYAGKSRSLPEDFRMRLRIKSDGRKIRVIGRRPFSPVTDTLILEPKTEGGFAVADAGRDIAKIAVIERHHNTGRMAAGFVRGLGLKRGAIGSSVAHDAHNFVVAGMDDESMCTAFSELARLGGGLVCAEGGKVLASFALPIGGLMSYLSAEEVCAQLVKMERSAALLGFTEEHAYMILSFLCLSVIPELKITDLGYVDITKDGVQSLFA